MIETKNKYRYIIQIILRSMFIHFMLFSFQIKILNIKMEFNFILTTSILIEKNYSQELNRGFKNVFSITEIETKIKY